MSTADTGADVIVVGGGLAGCVIAARLAGAGHRTLLLEAGPDYGPRSSPRWPRDLLDASAVPTSHDWGYRGPGSSGHPLALERCRAIGGCSTHNGTTQNVGWAGDYDAWAAAGSPGWDASTLAPLFTRALRQFTTRTYRQDEIQPFHRAVIAAATRRGMREVADFGDLTGGAGVGCAPVSSTPDGVRVNASFAYLDPQRDGGHLTVRGDARVKRVRVVSGRAAGVDVEIDGRVEAIDAPLVILSAGAYGSPEILLRSGIGPEDHIAELGIDGVHQLAGVGGNLHDQPTAQLEFAGSTMLTDDVAAFARSAKVMEEQTIVKLQSPYADAAPYDLHLYPWIEPDPARKGAWTCVIPVGLLRPRARGTVRLDVDDPEGNAVIDTNYLGHELDTAAIVFGLEWARELVADPLLAPYLGEAVLAPSDGADLHEWVRLNHRHYWHPVGTCRMGPASDPRAVVDPSGRVHGLSGLYVCDASVFPDVPRGTTALPTAVVGERIAEILLRDRHLLR